MKDVEKLLRPKHSFPPFPPCPGFPSRLVLVVSLVQALESLKSFEALVPHTSSHCSAEWCIRNNKVHFDQLLPSFTAASVGVINPSPSSANNKCKTSATSFVVVIFSFHFPFWGELRKGLDDFGPVFARGVAIAIMVVEIMDNWWARVDRPLPQLRPWTKLPVHLFWKALQHHSCLKSYLRAGD